MLRARPRLLQIWKTVTWRISFRTSTLGHCPKHWANCCEMSLISISLADANRAITHLVGPSTTNNLMEYNAHAFSIEVNRRHRGSSRATGADRSPAILEDVRNAPVAGCNQFRGSGTHSPLNRLVLRLGGARHHLGLTPTSPRHHIATGTPVRSGLRGKWISSAHP